VLLIGNTHAGCRAKSPVNIGYPRCVGGERPGIWQEEMLLRLRNIRQSAVHHRRRLLRKEPPGLHHCACDAVKIVYIAGAVAYDLEGLGSRQEL
jgi:hypothetical protein